MRSHASVYLLDLFKMEKEEQYISMFSDLVSKAQQVNDEKLLDNPYVKVKAFLENRK